MTVGTPIPTHRLSLETIEADPNTSKLVDMVLLLAIKDLATSVTFEPRQNDYRLSYRCSGQDYDMVPPPRNMAAQIGQRFKILAQLDHRNRQTPQEGMVRCWVDDASADVRVSIQPTRYGESVHLTIENNTTKWERVQALLAEAAGPPLDEVEIALEEFDDSWSDPPTISLRSAEAEGATYCHRLVSKRGATRGEWTLEWDNVNFCLSDPDGVLVLESASHHAGWCVDCLSLYDSDEICFYAYSLTMGDSGFAGEIARDIQHDILKFKKNPAAAKDLRIHFEQFVLFDEPYRNWLRTTVERRATIRFGVFLTSLCTIVLLLSYIAWSEEFQRPTASISWQWALGGFVGLLLVAIGGIGLKGWVYLRRVLRRIRDAERYIAKKATERLCA